MLQIEFVPLSLHLGPLELLLLMLRNSRTFKLLKLFAVHFYVGPNNRLGDGCHGLVPVTLLGTLN